MPAICQTVSLDSSARRLRDGLGNSVKELVDLFLNRRYNTESVGVYQMNEAIGWAYGVLSADAVLTPDTTSERSNEFFDLRVVRNEFSSRSIGYSQG